MAITCPTCGTRNPDSNQACAACGNPFGYGANLLALPVGTSLLNGTYHISKVLNQGGFGITYLAPHSALKATRVIKEFFPSQGTTRLATQVMPVTMSMADYNGAKTRFIQEAELIAKFNHENIIRVFDVFQENNTAYYVMDYIAGAVSLQDLLQQRGGSLPEGEAINYILQICKALEVVHQQNVLHRDIKPGNVLVTPQGKAVLIDFGAAREFIADKTVSHSVILTPGYAPLEQYTSRAQRGPCTDIYALGATLYHLLTGTVPPSAPDRTQGVCLPAPRQLNPQVSENVEKATLWSLETNAKNRPQNITEFANALKGAAPELGVEKIIKKAEIIAAGLGAVVAIFFARRVLIHMFHLSNATLIVLTILSSIALVQWSAFSALIKSQVSVIVKQALQKDPQSIVKLVGGVVGTAIIVSVLTWGAPLVMVAFPAITCGVYRFYLKDRLQTYLEREAGSESAQTMALAQLLAPAGVLTLLTLLTLAFR